jgi:hypothetical protein
VRSTQDGRFASFICAISPRQNDWALARLLQKINKRDHQGRLAVAANR